MANQAGNDTQWDILNLYLNGVPVDGIAQAIEGDVKSGTANYTWTSLHTADPTNSGNQSSYEVTGVTGYTRGQVARSTTSPKWSKVGSSPTKAKLGSAVSCGTATIVSGTVIVTHFTQGMASTGASKIIARGVISPPLQIIAGDPIALSSDSFISMD